MEIKRKHDRLFKIETNKKVINTPFFFPAISSVKTNFEIGECLKLIKKIGYPGFLVSSYDIYNAGEKEKNKLLGIISESTEGETLTLLDSGNYEAFWSNDKEWRFQNLESVLDKISVDFCFSFDIFWNERKNVKQHVKETVTSIAKTAGAQKSGTTIPLLHSDSKSFPEIVRRVVEGINPEVIGVPERELGSSIFERATTVKRIRDELDKTNRQIPLHLLGTGNPISILIFTLCGADIYDAIEWCKTVVDPETCHLFHFAQKELIDCNCSACKVKDVAYHTQTMAHNLIFYKKFTEKIRASIEKNEIDQVLDACLGSRNTEKVKKIAGLK
ncbi:Queuine tRNA-ribosyltransferase catalytic subunit 1 [subsurface metagenome]